MTLRPEQIARACPVCPACKEPLIARQFDRRFMEDDYYVECLSGHVWDLMGSREGPTDGKPSGFQREPE